MAEIIYGKNGTAKATAKSVRYTGQFMGVPQLEVEIDGPVPLGFEVGDYIVFSYDGIKYSIMDLPPVTKQASAGSTGDAFVYDSVVFKSPLGLLANVDFLDTVLNENNVHYSTLPIFEFYGTVKDFADRLQANINRLYSGWKVSVEGYDDSTNPNYDTLHEYSNISISNIKCSDSLSIPYETWGITYVFMVDAEGNNCIVFNHALDSTSAKRYGKGNGLYTLTKRMSTEKPVTNRLRAYGSTDNLPARYYNNLDGIDDGIYLPNLMIPRSKWKNQNDPITAYIDSTDIDENDTSMSRYGVREKSIYFDGSNDTEKIEPTIKGVTAGMIRAAKEEMGDTSNVPSATLYPDDERMDKIVEAESIADKGVESDGEVYMDSIGFNVSKGEDRTVVGTKNGLDPIIEDLETSMEISTPATYKVVSGNPTPFCRFNTGVGIAVDSAILNVYTVDEDGVKTLCDSVKIYSEVISGVNPDGGRYAYRDFYFAGSNGKDSPLYIKVPYKGVLLFQYNIVAGGADSVSLTMNAVSLTASTGPIILQNKFWVRIKQIGFDINSYPSTEEAKLVVNSGGCAGRSFNIVKNSTQFDEATGTWKFECFRSQDESLSQLFPNSIYKISEDDEFVLTGLEMPDLYVQMASQKLYDEAVKWLWKHKDGLEVFDLDIDNKVAYLDSVKIKEGMLLPLYDGNLNVGSEAENEEGETVITYDYRIIDSVTIEIGEEPIPVITAVLREEKEERIFKLLNKKVSEITARTTQNAVRMQVVRITEEVIRTTASTSASTPSAVIDTSDFVTLSTEQVIKGKKTFNGDAVFGGDGAKLFLPSTAGAGLYYAYFDATSAVPGETPTAGGAGGLDVDELWEELGGSSTDKRVSKDHLPTDVVYTETLSDYYTKTTADARFVTLATEQTISGKKTFSGDVVFGSGGGRMFVPSTAGAGLYYMYFDSTSAVPGETPTASGGGLDVDELWAELGGSSSYKVIASSHIPDLYVKNTGDTMTGDYTGFTRLISGYGTDSRRTKITSGNFTLLAATANWAGGVAVYTNDGSTLLSSLVGAYGESNNLKYIYMGGEYNNHILHIDLASKNVGIGTSNPAYKLDVHGTARIQNRLTLQTAVGRWINGKSGAPIMTSGDSTIDGMTYCPVIWGRTTAGDVWNLGHGATDQVGFFGFYSERTDNGTDWYTYIKVSTGNFYTSKNLYASGDIVAYSSSSIKLKDIVPHGSYSRRLAALGRVIDFRYNNILERDKNIHTGLIYEQVKSVMPSMCYEHEGYGALNYLCKDYINLIAGAAQEHTDELIRLKRKVRRLSGEVAKLRRALS